MQKIGNLPKTKELKRHMCRYNDGECSCDCFIKGQKAENKAWLSGKRCIDCGKEKDGEFISTCLKCLEEN